ncbi:MAG: hypothetical protein J7M26_06645, partial [Armatimonadetes bacterium]|nr:hypothetical protein [Armatimonadota bacterium]
MATLSLAVLLMGLGPADRNVTIFDGVLRWADDGSEVALFGVNYYVPFAESYQHIKRLGLDPREVIDQDVACFVRLGLSSIRLHVWDREISDKQGNLLDNEHLVLLDYLLWRCKQRGIYAVLTAMAWWPSPEGKVGFSSRFTMQQMTTDAAAWECQRRYLRQFVSHVNPHTGLAYKDDPAIIAFEPINEPLYPPGTSDEQVTRYINMLVDALRSTGCRKPVFYNCWGGREEALVASRADGPITGWYPTGLVAGAALWTNFLPAVAHYNVVRWAKLKGKPRLVYEFDAADVPGSYLYPAMARSFREAGVQVANQFQYDSLPLARYNRCWQTHYLNLIYAPGRAMSFAIAARAFRTLRRGTSFGDYPTSSRFGHCRVSYEEDLSEFADDEWFMSSNDTTTRPPNPDRLAHVWGCGSSPVVAYEGTGAYFLDRLGPGVWALMVYPDVVWVADPFGGPSFRREVSRLIWAARAMTVRLPDLGPEFTATPVSPAASGDRRPQTARQGKIMLRPGLWVLARPGRDVSDMEPVPFVCPRPDQDRPPAAWSLVPRLWRAGRACPVRISAALADGEPQSVQVWALPEGGQPQAVTIPRKSPYLFEGELPAEVLQGDRLRYAVALGAPEGQYVLPSGRNLSPEELRREAERRVVLWQAGAAVPRLDVFGKGAGKGSAEIESTDQGLVLRVRVEKFGPAPSCAA